MKYAEANRMVRLRFYIAGGCLFDASRTALAERDGMRYQCIGVSPCSAK